MTGEFDIIKKYFTFSSTRDDVQIASGDDCASVIVPENKQLLITTDTLIAGVHFPAGTSAEDIAYKAIMVNLSDLAAMGATPAWITLAITLPEVDEPWLQKFSATMFEILQRFNISLIGGDTTKGRLSITVQAMGLCDKDKIMRRNQAKAGDWIYVTGCLGDAAIGLHALLNKIDDECLQSCINKLNRPEARVKFAEQLVEHVNCAIDISDGLVADLGHIIAASQCGAQVSLSRIPVSPDAHFYFEKYNKGIIDWPMLLTRGDDYELCFTIAEDKVAIIEELACQHELTLSCIGEISEGKGLNIMDEDGKAQDFTGTGFKHF